MSINRNYKEYGYIDFTKLWDYMKKKGINKQYLLNHGMNKSGIYKLVNNDNVTCEVIAKLCYILNTQPKNIMDYKPPAAADQTPPGATQSHTEPPEEPPQLDPLDIENFTSFDDMTPEQLDALAKRHKARQAQEAPPETIPPEEWPFH